MRRSVRWIIGLGVGGAVFAVGALAVYAPDASRPAATPVDTFTHVDATVTDARLAITPSSIPAGLVEISVTDQRRHPSASLAIDSDLGALKPGTNVAVWHSLGMHTLSVTPALTAAVDVVLPQVSHPAPGALRIVIGPTGFSVPGVTVHREVPVEHGAVVGGDANWVMVRAGQGTLTVQNDSGVAQVCSIDRVLPATTLATAKRTSVPVTWATGRHALMCLGAGANREFDVWVA